MWHVARQPSTIRMGSCHVKYWVWNRGNIKLRFKFRNWKPGSSELPYLYCFGVMPVLLVILLKAPQESSLLFLRRGEVVIRLLSHLFICFCHMCVHLRLQYLAVNCNQSPRLCCVNLSTGAVSCGAGPQVSPHISPHTLLSCTLNCTLYTVLGVCPL